jgi:uncharacterized protein Yka (UPF0111/DUF47 family)
VFSDLAVFQSWFEDTELNSVEGNLEAISNRIVQMEEKIDTIDSTSHKILEPFFVAKY